MSQALTTKETETRVARPVRVLVPLIKEDLRNGKEAAERAGMPYYVAAGEKLLEAKSQMKHGEFVPWVERNFNIKIRQAQVYMALVQHFGSEKRVATRFTSLSDFQRETGQRPGNFNLRIDKPDYHEPVKQIIDRVDTETLNLKREELKRADEREVQKALALQLIDIGYKVLARTLHPDKGGSREAMARLNAVRDRLKQCI